MHCAVSLQTPIVTQLRSILPCFHLLSWRSNHHCFTYHLSHRPFQTTGFVLAQWLPSLTTNKHRALLLWGSSPDRPGCLKSMHRSTGRIRAQVSNRKTSYCRPTAAMGCKRWDSSPATQQPSALSSAALHFQSQCSRFSEQSSSKPFLCT